MDLFCELALTLICLADFLDLLDVPHIMCHYFILLCTSIGINRRALHSLVLGIMFPEFKRDSRNLLPIL